MSGLNASAKATLRDYGISQAEWARYHHCPDGRWLGDACGCTDDRCANGFHHMGPDDCGCLPVLIEQMLRDEPPRCGDEDHARRPAVAKLEWPDGRFVPCYACRTCVAETIRLYVTGDFDGVRHPLLITPLKDEGDSNERT